MPRTKNTIAPALEPVKHIKRAYLVVYYKDGVKIKQNSGGHYHSLVKLAQVQLAKKAYGADMVSIITRSSGKVRHTFVLKHGEVVPVLEPKQPIAPVNPRQAKLFADAKQVLTVEAVKNGGARFRMGRFLIDITVAE